MQSRPPNWGAGDEQALHLVEMPYPHGLEHSDHADHMEKLPSTRNKQTV